MLTVNNKKVVNAPSSGTEWRHAMLKDTDAGEWKWYYSLQDGKLTIRLRTAPIDGATATGRLSAKTIESMRPNMHEAGVFTLRGRKVTRPREQASARCHGVYIMHARGANSSLVSRKFMNRAR
jgi:hypothetical protein